MAARFWPRAWLCWGVGLLASFVLLEDAGFRRELHPTLSRVLARLLGYVTRWVARRLGLDPNRHRWIGPALFSAFWAALGVHVYFTEADQQADHATERNHLSCLVIVPIR